MMFTFSNFQFIPNCPNPVHFKNQLFLLFHTACISLTLRLSPFPFTRNTHVVCLQWNASQCVKIWIFNISNTDLFTQTIQMYIFDTNDTQSEYAFPFPSVYIWPLDLKCTRDAHIWLLMILSNMPCLKQGNASLHASVIDSIKPRL